MKSGSGAVKRQGKMGSGGYCVCTGCGHREPHRSGSPCMQQKCPECGKVMLREGSDHHKTLLEKKKKKADREK